MMQFTIMHYYKIMQYNIIVKSIIQCNTALRNTVLKIIKQWTPRIEMLSSNLLRLLKTGGIPIKQEKSNICQAQYFDNSSYLVCLMMDPTMDYSMRDSN